ncbi:ABC transporter ATP-binding protein [Streptomyces rhizosphaericus]|uniref:ABC transporter ATP-binding protein n=1 Tax=Streptomyces rhizosphaericus TaxID=114699 RepID=A0A6G4AD55_9ACTN|nr:ABC transporter ATP-binding protein [Streptomyces rhizosphaericus]NEW70764.1 ABC transporter ATP-binding protein [Streptomyces rhizosphaericus]
MRLKSPAGTTGRTASTAHSAAAGHTAAPTSSAVRVSAAVKRFDRSETAALGQVDLTVPAGSITVLLGPSGCGKTTLLRCVAGLETLTSGRIEIGDADVTDVAAEDRGVAMVFQNYALYPNKTVLGNIEFPLRMRRVDRVARRERALRAAELMRLGELLDRRPSELSGGQRQRVGIGRALVRDPAVLVMDEPFSNLDAALRDTMRTELVTLQRRLGMTVVFVTHDQVEALALADQLVVMRAGRIEQAGPPEEVYRTPATTFVATFLDGMNIFAAEGPFEACSPPGATTVGCRPDHLRVGAGGAADIDLRGQVLLTELRGRDRLIHLDIGGRRARMRVPADTRPSGEITLHVRRSDLHHFTADGIRRS